MKYHLKGKYRLKVNAFLVKQFKVWCSLFLIIGSSSYILKNTYAEENTHWDISDESSPNTVSADYADGTLTISGNGTMKVILPGSSLNDIPWYAFRNNITKVIIDGSITATNLRGMFRDLTNLKTIENLDKINTSHVTNMSTMFYKCNSLTKLDVSNFDTSKVTDMASMFDNCNSLTEVDVSNIDTSKVTDMSFMFHNCKSLTELDLSSFNTSQVTDMAGMFYNCQSLTELDLSNFNTSQVAKMNYMFYSCKALTELDVSNFNTNKVTSMYYMFNNCQALTELNVSKFDTSQVTDMSYMFYNCQVIKKLDVSNFNTNKVTGMYYMFCNCEALTELNVSNFDTSQVTDMAGMFYNCQVIKKLDVSNFDTSKVNNIAFMFYNCQSLVNVQGLDISNDNCYIDDIFEDTPHLSQIQVRTKKQLEIPYIDSEHRWYDEDGNILSDNNSGTAAVIPTSDDYVTYTLSPAITHDITYELDGGTLGSKQDKFEIVKEYELPIPTKKDYIFGGWYDSLDFKHAITKIEKNTTKDITVYAKWIGKTAIKADDFKVELSSETYTGNEITYTITSSLEGAGTPQINKLEKDGIEVSKVKEVGTYEITFDVPEADDYKSATVTKEFKISQATNGWKNALSIDNWTYKEEAKKPTSEAKFGEVKYTYSKKGLNKYTTTVPTTAGYWTVKATVEGTDNYKGIEATVDFKIDKANGKINITSSQQDLKSIYNGQPFNKTVNVEKPKDYTGTVTYKWEKKTGDSWKVLTDKPKDAGTYRVTAIAGADNNYKEALSEPVQFEIEKAVAPIITEPKNLSGGEGQKLSTVILSKGWTWVDRDIMFSVQNGGYKARLIVDDTNYDYTGVEGYNKENHYVERTLNVSVVSREGGSIQKEVKKGNNAPDVKIAITESQLANIVLTDEEKKAVEKGSDIKIVLTVDDGTQVSVKDKTAVESVLGKMKIGQYLDVSLLKIIDHEESRISQTRGTIRITIEIPESLRKANREFVMIRVHDGVATILKDLDTDANTITIETDRFSTYAIAYQDQDKQSNIAETEDRTVIGGYIILAGLSGMLLFINRKQKRI